MVKSVIFSTQSVSDQWHTIGVNALHISQTRLTKGKREANYSRQVFSLSIPILSNVAEHQAKELEEVLRAAGWCAAIKGNDLEQ